MTRIQLDLDPDRQALYAEAAARLRDVEIVDTSADALVTGAPGESELPILLDQAEHLPLSDLVRPAGARLMPAHPWRFAPNILPVSECLANGQLGEAGLLRTHHWLANKENREALLAAPQIDLAHWFFGAAPSRVHSLARPNYLQMHLAYPNDGMALIDIATNRPGRDDYYSLHLIGSDGAAYADDHRNAQLHFAGDGSHALLRQPDDLLATRNMLGEFVAGIREERAWSVTLQDIINALTTLKEVTHA
jgi:predicted dehydrogenase